jgi:Zn-finger nucleic acid-binding protein
MKCPVCNGVNLKIAERQGVEIDYCPQCRGIWLDRGELDKIIERSFQQVENSTRVQSSRTLRHSDYQDDEQERSHSKYSDYNDSDRGRRAPKHSDYYDEDKPERSKRKRGFLEDLFDFD